MIIEILLPFSDIYRVFLRTPIELPCDAEWMAHNGVELPPERLHYCCLLRNDHQAVFTILCLDHATVCTVHFVALHQATEIQVMPGDPSLAGYYTMFTDWLRAFAAQFSGDTEERRWVALFEATYQAEKQQGKVKSIVDWLEQHSLMTTERNFAHWRKKYGKNLSD